MIPDLELSDPRFETDGTRLLTVDGPALGGRGGVSLPVPGGIDPAQPLPVVIILHGVYRSHWNWFANGGTPLGPTARRRRCDPAHGLGLPVRRPVAGRLLYLDHAGGAFETWIKRDVVGAIRQLLGRPPDTSPLVLAGLSMGGYGDLRLGAIHVDAVAGISGHSSVTTLRSTSA
jgi:hypothetical protein